jgi:hypothetical protein
MSKTETIQVFCNKSIKFKHPKDEDVVAFVRDHEFAPAPSWIADTDMFAALVKDGDMRIISSAADLAGVEQKGKVIAKVDEIEAAKVAANVEDDEDNDNDGNGDGVIALTEMSCKNLYALCTEKGIEAEQKQPKQYYVDKLNAIATPVAE